MAEEGSEGAAKSAAGRVGRKEIQAPTQGTEVLFCGAASAGIRLQNNEPVGQLSRQVAKTERRISEMAAHLAGEKHQ